MFDNFEWSEQVIKVPTLASDSFDKEWIIAENPTILDFKNANGNISFESTTDEQMRISANITIYGKYDEATVEEAFAVRHQYVVDEDKLTWPAPAAASGSGCGRPYKAHSASYTGRPRRAGSSRAS